MTTPVLVLGNPTGRTPGPGVPAHPLIDGVRAVLSDWVRAGLVHPIVWLPASDDIVETAEVLSFDGPKRGALVADLVAGPSFAGRDLVLVPSVASTEDWASDMAGYIFDACQWIADLRHAGSPRVTIVETIVDRSHSSRAFELAESLGQSHRQAVVTVPSIDQPEDGDAEAFAAGTVNVAAHVALHLCTIGNWWISTVQSSTAATTAPTTESYSEERVSPIAQAAEQRKEQGLGNSVSTVRASARIVTDDYLLDHVAAAAVHRHPDGLPISAPNRRSEPAHAETRSTAVTLFLRAFSDEMGPEPSAPEKELVSFVEAIKIFVRWLVSVLRIGLPIAALLWASSIVDPVIDRWNDRLLGGSRGAGKRIRRIRDRLDGHPLFQPVNEVSFPLDTQDPGTMVGTAWTSLYETLLAATTLSKAPEYIRNEAALEPELWTSAEHSVPSPAATPPTGGVFLDASGLATESDGPPDWTDSIAWTFSYRLCKRRDEAQQALDDLSAEQAEIESRLAATAHEDVDRSRRVLRACKWTALISLLLYAVGAFLLWKKDSAGWVVGLLGIACVTMLPAVVAIAVLARLLGRRISQRQRDERRLDEVATLASAWSRTLSERSRRYNEFLDHAEIIGWALHAVPVACDLTGGAATPSGVISTDMLPRSFRRSSPVPGARDIEQLANNARQTIQDGWVSALVFNAGEQVKERLQSSFPRSGIRLPWDCTAASHPSARIELRDLARRGGFDAQATEAVARLCQTTLASQLGSLAAEHPSMEVPIALGAEPKPPRGPISTWRPHSPPPVDPGSLSQSLVRVKSDGSESLGVVVGGRSVLTLIGLQLPATVELPDASTVDVDTVTAQSDTGIAELTTVDDLTGTTAIDRTSLSPRAGDQVWEVVPGDDGPTATSGLVCHDHWQVDQARMFLHDASGGSTPTAGAAVLDSTGRLAGLTASSSLLHGAAASVAAFAGEALFPRVVPAEIVEQSTLHQEMGTSPDLKGRGRTEEECNSSDWFIEPTRVEFGHPVQWLRVDWTCIVTRPAGDGGPGTTSSISAPLAPTGTGDGHVDQRESESGGASDDDQSVM